MKHIHASVLSSMGHDQYYSTPVYMKHIRKELLGWWYFTKCAQCSDQIVFKVTPAITLLHPGEYN